jgi:hypothetical protein
VTDLLLCGKCHRYDVLLQAPDVTFGALVDRHCAATAASCFSGLVCSVPPPFSIHLKSYASRGRELLAPDPCWPTDTEKNTKAPYRGARQKEGTQRWFSPTRKSHTDLYLGGGWKEHYLSQGDKLNSTLRFINAELSPFAMRSLGFSYWIGHESQESLDASGLVRV